jgi:hypothetical protein
MSDGASTTLRGKVAFITGASSGIGAATALALAEGGADLALGARRTERLADVAEAARSAGAGRVWTHGLDMRDRHSIELFCRRGLEALGGASLLVNNAGGARGLDPVATARDEHWVEMVESNVLGVLRTTRALLPALVASGGGHIVLLGSIAGHQAYEGGAAYCATKSAVSSIRAALRQELVGQRVRVSTVDPGMVETEFSLARFDGDASRAAAVYRGLVPLQARDVAEIIRFVVTCPRHVNIDEILVTPQAQAAVHKIHRQ